eukprot:9450159-Ditylum_brightwellii.AAC.1
MQRVDLQDAKIDHPQQTAQYIDEHCMPQLGNKGRDQVQSWAKKMLWDLNRAIRQIAHLYDFYIDEDENIGEVLWNAKHAIKLDEKNGNTMWQDAMTLEDGTLNELE